MTELPPILPPAPPAADAKTARTAQDFEAAFLTQFVDEMLKTAGDTVFGSKEQSEMWRSFMSDAVAEHLAAQGGLGLSAPVAQMIAAYSEASKPAKEP